MEENKIKISVGVVVFRKESILFGRAKNREGRTRYILPVGHLEFMESFHDCVKREISEECGIHIKNIKFHFLSNTDNYKPAQYIHIGLTAEWESGEPKVLEPDGVEEWEWRERNDIPRELSIGAALTIKALEEGKPMYDLGN